LNARLLTTKKSLPSAVLAVVVAGVAGITLFSFNPASNALYPRCMFHEMTGLYCPGCGTTRAFHQFLHGNLGAAFRSNVLAISLLPLAGYLMVWGGQRQLKPTWIWLLLGVAIAFGVLRNIPVYPFTLMIP
jgi:Protein of unknown function (DUF2752)